MDAPPKFNEKTPREGRKERILRREKEKKRNVGPSTLHGPHLWVHPSNRFGQSRFGLAEVGLAKVGFHQMFWVWPHPLGPTMTHTHTHRSKWMNVGCSFREVCSFGRCVLFWPPPLGQFLLWPSTSVNHIINTIAITLILNRYTVRWPKSKLAEVAPFFPFILFLFLSSKT